MTQSNKVEPPSTQPLLSIRLWEVVHYQEMFLMHHARISQRSVEAGLAEILHATWNGVSKEDDLRALDVK